MKSSQFDFIHHTEIIISAEYILLFFEFHDVKTE